MAFAMYNPRQSNYEYLNVHTAYGSTLPAQDYNYRLQNKAAIADAWMINYLAERDEIWNLFALINQVSEQGADWDDEEGQPVSYETAERAKGLLRTVAQRAEQGGWAWASPAVSATPEGGIHFSWLVAGSRVALTVFAPPRPMVCVSKLRGEASRRELHTEGNVVDQVLQILQSSAPTVVVTAEQ